MFKTLRYSIIFLLLISGLWIGFSPSGALVTQPVNQARAAAGGASAGEALDRSFKPVPIDEITLRHNENTVTSSLHTSETSLHTNSILWDQPLSTIDTYAYVNQEFVDAPDYSSFLADDFINSEPWAVSSIFVPGYLWNGPMDLSLAYSLTWMIFADNMGVPDGNPYGGNEPVWWISLPPTDTQVVMSIGRAEQLSDVTLYLTQPVLLPPGHYWLIFYPQADFSTFGQYGREASDTYNGYIGKFINPGGAWGYGTDWQDWTVIGATQYDIAFRLEGEVTLDIPTRTPTPTVTKTSTPTVTRTLTPTVTFSPTPTPTNSPWLQFFSFLPFTQNHFTSYFLGPWEEELNNTFASANGPLILNKDYYGYPNDAEDIYSIFLTQTTTITINLTNQTASGVQLLLYGSDPYSGHLVVDNIAPFQIVYSAPPGLYYLRVYAVSGFNTSYPYNLSVASSASILGPASLPGVSATITPPLP